MGGQTKRQLEASQKLTLPCVDLRVRSARALDREKSLRANFSNWLILTFFSLLHYLGLRALGFYNSFYEGHVARTFHVFRLKKVSDISSK